MMNIRSWWLAAVLLWTCGPGAVGQTGTFIDRQSPTHVRVVSYNINWDAIFPDGDPGNHQWRAFDMSQEFRRVVAALDPDVLCLQEINFDRDPQDVGDILDDVLPLGGGQTWRTHSGSDNVIASRYDLLMPATDTIPTTNRDQAMVLVDLPDGLYDRDIYLMNAHFKAGGSQSDINRRQQHADAIIHWIGDIKTPGGYIDLIADTPIVVLGDLNVYDTDPHHHLTTVLTGDIVNEGTYGPDVIPDWDDTDNADALPSINGLGLEFYTWRSDNSSFNPGALDRIIYSDSACATGNKFVLNTADMSPQQLAATGLQQYDVVLNPADGYYDHLPLVVDFDFSPAIQPDGDVSLDGLVNGVDIAWFVDLILAGPAGDPQRIAHADYNANGIVDGGDLSGFLDDLLMP